jgi:hypothetical protein
MIFCLTLEELGHPQPKTHVHYNNAMGVSITNNTVKRQRSRSMEMCYFWVCDYVAQEAYAIRWHPGQKKLADCQSKHHVGAHHRAVCPWYLHNINSPLVLPWATRPSITKGCVGTLLAGYVRNMPLPWVPLCQSTQSHQVDMIPDYYEVPYVVPTCTTPCSLVESTAHAFSPAWQAIAINT